MPDIGDRVGCYTVLLLHWKFGCISALLEDRAIQTAACYKHTKGEDETYLPNYDLSKG